MKLNTQSVGALFAQGPFDKVDRIYEGNLLSTMMILKTTMSISMHQVR